MRFRDREEREHYMDSLERQMEHQREQIQRTLDEMEGSTQRWTALKSKLRRSLPSFAGRASAQDAGEREAAGPVEPTPSEPAKEPSQRPWWRRVFGG